MPDLTPRGEYANNSYYTASHLFSGFMFGAMEYSLMTAQGFRIDVAVFLLLSFVPLFHLLAKKAKLVSRNQRAFALCRPYRHIFADFFFAISTVSSFSILVYTITRGLPLLDNHFDLSIHAIILLFNLVLFFCATYLFSVLAQEERNLIGDSA